MHYLENVLQDLKTKLAMEASSSQASVRILNFCLDRCSKGSLTIKKVLQALSSTPQSAFFY